MGMNQPETDLTWSAEAIADATYRSKFCVLPSVIRDWFGDLAGGDILDFGCGEATTALGLALQHGPRRVVGVDIMPDVERCAPDAARQLGLARLPANLELYQVKPGLLHNATDRFDLIYSWSVFEHVDERVLPAILSRLRSALKPAGRLFIQIAPLFYSADGSHLMYKIPEPWGHLTNQYSIYLEKLQAACSDRQEFEALKSMYETLNRITAAQLVDEVRAAGFEILRDYRTDRDDGIPAKIEKVFDKSLLLNEQIVILAQKNGD
jgi:cyclopropane fatty-acyl-phospholipid synthase-like methyltransferase